MYPLQLLTGNVLLVTIFGMLATTLQLATVGRELMSIASPPTVSEMPAPPTRTKCQHCSSNQEATISRPEEEGAAGLDITPKEQSPWKWKEGRPLVRLLKEAPWGKTPNSSEWLDEHVSKCTTPTMTTRGPMTSPISSRRWPPLLSSWALISMRSRRCGLAKRTSRSLTTWQ